MFLRAAAFSSWVGASCDRDDCILVSLAIALCKAWLAFNLLIHEVVRGVATNRTLRPVLTLRQCNDTPNLEQKFWQISGGVIFVYRFLPHGYQFNLLFRSHVFQINRNAARANTFAKQSNTRHLHR